MQQYYSDGTEKPDYKALDANDFFYTELNKATFKTKMSSIAKADGSGNYNIDGYTPTKMEKDGENYTVLYSDGTNEVKV